MPGNNHRQIHVSRGAIRHLLLFLPPTEEAIIQAAHQNENNGLCSSLDITDNWAVPQISAEQPVLAGFSMLLSASHLSRDIESVLYVGWNWLFLWFFFVFYLFTLDIILDLGYLDFHGIQFLIRYQWDVGNCLGLIHHLETKVSEWDVPFAVILLAFSERQKVQTFAPYWCLANTHFLFLQVIPHYSS